MSSNRFAHARAMHAGAVLPMTVVVALAITGCAATRTVNTATSSPSPVAPSLVAPSPKAPTSDPATTPASAGTAIVIEIAGRKITGELDHSATSLSLLAQLPLTLSFSDYGGQEKVARIPAPLDLRSAPSGSDAAPLTIGYYVPDQRLILYYDDVGYFDGIVPIGTYEDISAVTGLSSDFTATLRQAG